jgi:hypothetical protein
MGVEHFNPSSPPPPRQQDRQVTVMQPHWRRRRVCGGGASLPPPPIISGVPDCHTYEGLGVGGTTTTVDTFLKKKV